MKKLFVNAQVTATISLIEMGTNVLHTTLLKYFRGTNFYNLLQSMIVYDIVLPYAFLMNTSHNKKRIVESGWKNVLKKSCTLIRQLRLLTLKKLQNVRGLL